MFAAADCFSEFTSINYWAYTHQIMQKLFVSLLFNLQKLHKLKEKKQSSVWLTWEAGNVNPAWQHSWDQRHRGFPGGGQGLRDHPFPGRGYPLHSDVPCWPHGAPSQPGERCRKRDLVIVHEDLWPSWLSVLMESILWAWRWGKNRPVFMQQPPSPSLPTSGTFIHFLKHTTSL